VDGYEASWGDFQQAAIPSDGRWAVKIMKVHNTALRRSLRGVYHATRLRWFQATHGIDISDSPSFDAEGLAAFKKALPGVRTYLEYGAGGSTVLASRYVDKLFSVESDAWFMRAVERKVRANGATAEKHFLHANIGMTEFWGKPAFTSYSEGRLRRWTRYPQMPWKHLEAAGLVPDLILIDGRFRVACMLECLVRVKDKSTAIFFDDYFDRESYSVVERFADMVDRAGRMAIFRRKPSMDVQACNEVLREHYGELL
jgi:hypothetical protein